MATIRAKTTDIRKALDVASALTKAGIDFVPVAVTSEQQKKELVTMSFQALQELESQAE